MNWDDKLAARTHRVRRNTVREFLKFAGRADIISFAGGLPDTTLLPVKETEAATARMLERVGANALQYGPSEGIPELREFVASKHGVAAGNVLITTGSQQGLDLIGRVLLEDGDGVVVQNPTYLAALSAWSPYGVNFNTLEHWIHGGDRAKIVYAIPNFQNPTGETMSMEFRSTLLRLSAERDMALVEDDAYGDLRFEGVPGTPLLHGSNGQVLHLGSLSKVLAPGLRLGWIIAHDSLIPRFVTAKQSIDLHTSTYAQHLAWEMIHSGALNELIPRAREVYRRKRDAMLEALQRAMPSGVYWSKPEGGLFLFLRLPVGMNGRSLAKRALEMGVLVVPGEEFHIQGGEETLRLNFSHPAEKQITRGIETLATLVQQKQNE